MILKIISLTVLTVGCLALPVSAKPLSLDEKVHQGAEATDALTGQNRVVKKGDVVLVGTKQCIDVGQVVQRNAVRYSIMPKGSQISKSQCSKFEQCIGKVAVVSLSGSTCLGLQDLKTSSHVIKTSKVVKAIVPIAQGEFVDPKWVTVTEEPVPPNKTPVEWLSNLRDVVGRKTIKALRSGEIVTENNFGPRGNMVQTEEIKIFPGFN